MTSVVRSVETELGSVLAVAKRIIEMAKSGERDPNQLRDRALTACGHKRLIPLLPRN
jgi:hypothetical protein